MLFPTPEFALFFIVVFLVSWRLRARRHAWMLFILAASYVFYAWWDWRFVPLLAGVTVFNQRMGNAIHRAGSSRARRALVVAAVTGNLGVLGFFKYYEFGVVSAANGLRALGFAVDPPLLAVILPLGISFFIFQALSYVIDVYRRDTEPVTPTELALYLSFFPHLVAGPIVRATELVPQLREVPDAQRLPATEAFFLILGGLFKKVVVASYLGVEVVDPVFAVPSAHSALQILVAVYAYAIQIYADFSGYTDIAIGIALLLGIRLPQNFDRPYAAQSLREFWRRWHMTLSRWLRDYLYIPLGGNRGSAARSYCNLMVTMLLGGLWHGAAWTFVAWGGLHGVFLSVGRWRRDGAPPPGATREPDARSSRSATRAALAWLATFNLVCLAWVFFRAESLPHAFAVLRGLVDVTHLAPAPSFGPIAVIAGMLAWQFVPRRAFVEAEVAFSRLGPLLQGAALAVGFFVIDTLGPAGVPPFIYFQF